MWWLERFVFHEIFAIKYCLVRKTKIENNSLNKVKVVSKEKLMQLKPYPYMINNNIIMILP